MGLKRLVIGVLGLFFSLCIVADEKPLVIENVTLIDGLGGKPIADTSVRILAEKIDRIIRGSFSETEKMNATIINGKGKYLIPGLVDVHIHLSGGVEVTPTGLRKKSIDLNKGLQALHGFLFSGVTSIYDAGNNPDFVYALRDKERAGAIIAPRIFATGGIVTYPGSHGSGAGATLVDRWPEGKAELDIHIARKPDLLKLTYEERGWGARPMIPMLPLDLMEKIIQYYNEKGIRTTVHTSSERRALQAIFAGVDTLAHPVIQGPVSDGFAKLMGAKKIPMATTLTIGENYSRLVEHPEYLDQYLYQAVLEKEEIEKLKTVKRLEYKEYTWTWWMKIMTGVAQENVQKVHAAGGVLALGTDQSSGPAVHREMELLSSAGIPNLDVLRIATMNGAIWLGKAAEFGSIEEGKLADLVLLNADPVQDINNTKTIEMVIKNGQIIRRDRLKLPINKN